MSAAIDFATSGEDRLLRGLRDGDQAAFRRLVDLHSAAVYRVALGLLRNEQDAEDVLQETFLSAFQAIDRFEARSKLSTWLFRIAYNASLMRLRKREVATAFSLDDAVGVEDDLSEPDSRLLLDWSTMPDNELLTAEARDEMERAIADLPEALRSAFVLRDIEGLSGVDTAEVLGISVQAVKNRLHRARLRLRERLSIYFAERAGGERGAGNARSG